MNTITAKRDKTKKKKKAEENYNHRFDWSSGNGAIQRKMVWRKVCTEKLNSILIRQK